LESPASEILRKPRTTTTCTNFTHDDRRDEIDEIKPIERETHRKQRSLCQAEEQIHNAFPVAFPIPCFSSINATMSVVCPLITDNRDRHLEVKK